MKMLKPKRILAVLLSVLVVAELVVSVVLSTVAEDSSSTPETTTATKHLIDFTDSEVATGIGEEAWPEGISKMTADDDTYPYSSTFRVDIAEDADGNKFLKFNMNQTSDVTRGANTTISSRGSDHNIFVKAEIPYKYIAYLKDIKLDYEYNYKTSKTTEEAQAFYFLGVTDGVSFGKDVRSHYVLDPSGNSAVNGSVTANVTDMKKLNKNVHINTLTGNTTDYSSASNWTKEDLEMQANLSVIFLFSAPDIDAADRNKGYYFAIKDLSITLEGPKDEIDNIDAETSLDTHIVNFEEGTTLDEIKTATGFEYAARGELVTDDAHTEPNSYLYKRSTEGTDSDYNTKVVLGLDKSTMLSLGVTFMAKNISDRDLTFRVWMAPGNAVDSGENQYKSKGKYQYIFTLPANMTEYKRISIFWNDVGIMSFNGAEWTSASTSGYSIPETELAGGMTLRITNPGIKYEDAGSLFDTFEYISPEFAAERIIDLVNFNNSDDGSEDIPSNIEIGGTYKGSKEIITKIDGSKALKLNYDAEANATAVSDADFIKNRPYFQVSVSVPKGTLDDVTSISVNTENNRATLGTLDTENGVYSNTYYVIGVSAGDDYGKAVEKSTELKVLGSSEFTTNPLEMLRTSSSDVIGLSKKVFSNGTDAPRWTAEQLKEVDKIHFFITAPNGAGMALAPNGEVENVVINSIVLKYNEPPRYEENGTRSIAVSEKNEPINSDSISVTELSIGNTDPNYALFDKAFEVNVTDAANTEKIVFTNDLTVYHRNLVPFMDTAIFHMFAFVDKNIKLSVSFVDKNGAEMTGEVELTPYKSKLYSEAQFAIKDVYEKYITADPDFAFDLTDIRRIQILPLVSDVCTFKIADIAILTGGYVYSEEDPEALKRVNLVNFDNCEVGTNQLPSNVTITNYTGSTEIAETADGSHALQINADVKVETEATSQLHQLINRKYVLISVSVPKGSLENISKAEFTVINNSNTPTDVKGHLQNIYTAVSFSGGGHYLKSKENAVQLKADVGVPEVLTLDPAKGLGGSKRNHILNWLNPDNSIPVTDEILKNYDCVEIYIGIPDCNGTEGWNLQLASIDLEFKTAPAYNESETRMIVDADRLGDNDSETITATESKLASNDVNYRKIKTIYTIEAKKGNTAPIAFINGQSKFLRNATAFVENAKFRIYAHSDKATKIVANIVNLNGEKLPTEINIKKSSSATYDEYIIPFKTIYENFKTKYPNERFSLTDIYSIEIMPDSSSAAKFNVAGISLWTQDPGSGSSGGNYYRATEDQSAYIEGYNNAIADDFTTIIEVMDAAAQVAAEGIRIPKGSTPVAMVKFTLRNSNNETVEPANRFWISIKIPQGVDINDLGLYRVFFDGSVVKEMHSFEPNNYISCSAFFSSETYLVLSGVKPKPVVEEEDIIIEEDNVIDDTSDDEEYIIEDVEIEETEDEEPNETIITTPSQVVRTKKLRRKNTTTDADFTWLWILIGVVAASILVAVGLVIFFVIRKKRRKENVTT